MTLAVATTVLPSRIRSCFPSNSFGRTRSGRRKTTGASQSPPGSTSCPLAHEGAAVVLAIDLKDRPVQIANEARTVPPSLLSRQESHCENDVGISRQISQ